MKNASTKIAAATAGDTAQSRQSVAERRRDSRKAARERVEAERERREIRQELRAAGLLQGEAVMLKRRHRHQPPRLRLISERPLSLVGSPSFVLHARPQDDGAMWPALAGRCRRTLPASLRWAAPLLDTEHPLPVLCGEPQVVELYRWLDALPNTARVSIARQRQTLGTGQRAR